MFNRSRQIRKWFTRRVLRLPGGINYHHLPFRLRQTWYTYHKVTPLCLVVKFPLRVHPLVGSSSMMSSSSSFFISVASFFVLFHREKVGQCMCTYAQLRAHGVVGMLAFLLRLQILERFSTNLMFDPFWQQGDSEFVCDCPPLYSTNIAREALPCTI